MGRQLAFDIGDRVHARVMGRTEVIENVQVEKDGKPVFEEKDGAQVPVMEDRVVFTQGGNGQMVAKKRDIVLAEFDGKVDGIAVNYDDDGPYVDYSIAFAGTDGKGREMTHFKWVREKELTKLE